MGKINRKCENCRKNAVERGVKDKVVVSGIQVDERPVRYCTSCGAIQRQD